MAENYRKITSSHTIINIRLVYYQRFSNEEDPFQNGFNEKSCTIDNAFILNGIIEKYKALGQHLYIYTYIYIYIYVMLTLSLHSIISIEMPYSLNY